MKERLHQSVSTNFRGGVENDIQKCAHDLCTVLVMGCDEYYDVLELNGEFREKYYQDCKCAYFCCTQEKRPQRGKYDKIVLNNSSDVWTVRLHNALDQIDTPYVMLILDDFFFSCKVDEVKITEYLNVMQKNFVGMLKLIPEDERRYTLVETEREFGEMEKDSPFRVNFTVGIWKKDFLYDVTPERCSVWEAERLAIEESRKYPYKVWTVREDNIGFVHAIMSGGWTRSARKFFQKENLEKMKYCRRKNKPWYIYCKDVIYNLMAMIAPKLMMKIVKMLKIGRK